MVRGRKEVAKNVHMIVSRLSTLSPSSSKKTTRKRNTPMRSPAAAAGSRHIARHGLAQWVDNSHTTACRHRLAQRALRETYPISVYLHPPHCPPHAEPVWTLDSLDGGRSKGDDVQVCMRGRYHDVLCMWVYVGRYMGVVQDRVTPLGCAAGVRFPYVRCTGGDGGEWGWDGIGWCAPCCCW